MAKVRYPAVVFKQLAKYPLKHCALASCAKVLTPRFTNDKLESVASFKKRSYCNQSCATLATSSARLVKARAAKVAKRATQTPATTPVGVQVSPPAEVIEPEHELLHDKQAEQVAPELLPIEHLSKPKQNAERQGVLDQLRASLPPKRETRPVAKAVQVAKKEPSGRKVRTAPKLVQPEPTPAFATVIRPETEIERERRGRVDAGTWDPTPRGKKIPIDVPLKLALFAAFAEHAEDVFLDVFGARHPNLIYDYRRWLELNPVLKERLGLVA